MDKFFDNLRQKATKPILTAQLGTVNNCCCILHINPLHLQKYNRSVQRGCLNECARESCLPLRIFKGMNIPVDKNCIVGLLALVQQVSVSPKDKKMEKTLQ